MGDGAGVHPEQGGRTGLVMLERYPYRERKVVVSVPLQGGRCCTTDKSRGYPCGEAPNQHPALELAKPGCTAHDSSSASCHGEGGCCDLLQLLLSDIEM